MTAPQSAEARTVEQAQAEYDALKNKRGKRAYALRQEIKALKASRDDARYGAGVPSPMAEREPAAVPAPRAAKVTAPDVSEPRRTEKAALYWVGMTPVLSSVEDDSAPRPPFSSTTVAGITFQTAFTPWEGPTPENPDHKRGYFPGALVELTASDVDRLAKTLTRAIVRWRQRDGRHAHGYKIVFADEDTIADAKKRYALTEAQVVSFRMKAGLDRWTQGDEPLAKYLYCQKLPQGCGAKEGGTYRPSGKVPPSILEVGEIEYP